MPITAVNLTQSPVYKDDDIDTVVFGTNPKPDSTKSLICQIYSPTAMDLSNYAVGFGVFV